MRFTLPWSSVTTLNGVGNRLLAHGASSTGEASPSIAGDRLERIAGVKNQAIAAGMGRLKGQGGEPIWSLSFGAEDRHQAHQDQPQA
jgi:hypothetical protein